LFLRFKGHKHRCPFRDEAQAVNHRDFIDFREEVEVIFTYGEHADCELSILHSSLLVSITIVVHDLTPLDEIGVSNGRATCV
jgi:hypothetical protein